MHFPFQCLKSAPSAFRFVEILSKKGWNLKSSNLSTIEILKRSNRAKKYMLKVHNWSTRRSWEICPKLTIKIPERRYWPRSDVFIVNLTYFTRYSTASAVGFEQEMLARNRCYGSLSTLEQKTSSHYCLYC